MSYLRTNSFKCASIVLVVFISSLCAAGQVLRGSVVNGTTKKPAGGDDVILLKIDRGMTEEKRTKSNARGEFSFDLPDSQSMRAVRVMHDKLSYYQPVAPGSANVTVTVYESKPTVQGVHQSIHSMIFQAQGNNLEGYLVVNVKNDSNPPLTQPAFTFYLPEGAKVESGQAVRRGAMPLKVGAVPLGDNKYSISYLLLPGETHFEIPYTLPYTGTLKLQPKLTGVVDKFLVITPKSMGFAAGVASEYHPTDPNSIGADLQGMDVHEAVNTTDEQKLAFSIAGEGLIPQDSGQQAAGGQAPAGRPGEPETPGGGMGIPNERPNPLSQGQWAFLAVLTLFLAGGAAFIYMSYMSSRPGEAVVAAPRKSSASPSLLDALKEEMFQLEAERIHGKVSPQDYQSAKTALDRTLQRAMKK